jgi:hypothetical protein
VLGLAPLAGGGLLSAIGVFISDYETMLTIEDGTIVEDADSYVTIDNVATYATRYGGTWSPATDLVAEQAILRAMLYIEGFDDQYCGSRVSAAQELSWPREYVPNPRAGSYLSSSEIPKGLKNAVCEAAIIELASPGTLQTSSLSSTQTVKRLKQKVDVLEKETEYFEGTQTAKRDRFEKINAWLEPFLCVGSNKVVRG